MPRIDEGKKGVRSVGRRVDAEGIVFLENVARKTKWREYFPGWRTKHVDADNVLNISQILHNKL